MRPATIRPLVTLGVLASCVPSCNSGTEPIPFEENVDISVCDPGAGGFTTTVDNPYFPLPIGRQLMLQGGGLDLVITVLDTTETVAGVTTLVLEEHESENGQLVEISRNFFVQAADGSVCYYGEDVDIYQNGTIVSHEGAWRAGMNNAIPGIFMPAAPQVGMQFRQEVAPGIALDRAEIKAVGESVTVPTGTYTETVRFLESTPLEPGATSKKVFARDVGLIVDDRAKLVGYTP